jgi:hypothetical protein
MEFGMNVLEIGHCEISCVTSVSPLFLPICATLISLLPSVSEVHPTSCEEFLGKREKSERNLP